MACLKLMVLAFAFSALLAVCFSRTEFELNHTEDNKQDYRDEGSSQEMLEQNLHVPYLPRQTCTCQELQNELKHLTDENKEVKMRLQQQDAKIEAFERKLPDEFDNDMNQSKRTLEQVGSITEGCGSNIAGKTGINMPFAFSTYLSPGLFYAYLPNQTLQYDVVLTNEGGAYDVETGEFTVPIDGLYFFSFSQVGALNSETTLVLTIDEKQTLTGGARDNNMGGNAAVLRLYKGQKVRVQCYPTENTYVVSYLDYGLPSFSGFLFYVL